VKSTQATTVTPPESIVVRPPRREEAPDVAAMITAATAGWFAWPQTTPETILAWWDSPAVQLERDARVALAPDGLAGYVLLLPSERWRSTFWLDMWTKDDHASTAAAGLLTSLEPSVTALARRAAPAATVRLRLQVEEERHGLREALEQHGFEIVRSPLRMVAELDRADPTPTWPEGISVRTYLPTDARSVYEFQTAVLGDTWEFVSEPFENWVKETEAPTFDPSLWWLAEQDGELAGVLLCRVDPAEPDLAWMHVLGVRRSFRGVWLWRGLLLHALQEFRARGLRQVGLGVDADNPTGACLLARRFGFRVAQTFWTYERRLRGPQHVRRLLRRAGRAAGLRASR
jgi:mycothiol synthase